MPDLIEERGRLGRHVPIAEGIIAALHRTRTAGYDAIQVFPGNPKGWQYLPLAPDIAAGIRVEAAQLDIAPIVIHAPYIINLATSDSDLATKSARALANALDRGREIGAQYVVVHAGSHKGAGEEEGITHYARLVENVLANAPANVTLLVENSAGAGNALAGSPAALGRLLAALPTCVGACIDTAHLWGSGCDLATSNDVERTVERLDRAIGLDRLRVLHLNDSRVPLDSKRDVHAKLGEGMIGLTGLAAVMTHPALRDTPIILETPLEDDPAREAARCAMTYMLRQGDIDSAAAYLATLQEEESPEEAVKEIVS